MQYRSFGTAFLLFSTPVLAQHVSCCSAPAAFAVLGRDPEFVAAHADPLPYHFAGGRGNMIRYACPAGADAQAYFIPTEIPSDKYLIVFHEWWGLNDYIKKTCEQLFEDLDGKVNILAPDLYDGQVATNSEEASAIMQSLDSARVRSIMQGALNRVGNNAHIATWGWCMGGGYSMQEALLAKNRAYACVMFYGMPERDPEKLQVLHAPVLLVWATKDSWINKDVVGAFQKNMDGAGKQLTVLPYDANHAFANPSNPKYDKEAAEDAYAKALVFIKNQFGN